MVSIITTAAAAILTVLIILTIVMLATPFIMNAFEDYYEWADEWCEQCRRERRGRRN